MTGTVMEADAETAPLVREVAVTVAVRLLGGAPAGAL
jgi:hypothetical protein